MLIKNTFTIFLGLYFDPHTIACEILILNYNGDFNLGFF